MSRRTVEIVAGGCWHLNTKPSPSGYSRLSASGKVYRGHRYYYTLFKGPILDGLTIDHLCRNRRCVNPAHLEPVTQRENTLRSPLARASINAAKTHCSRGGHPLSGENLYVDRNGVRSCRTCQRENDREYQRRTGNARKRQWENENRDRVNANRRERRARKRALGIVDGDFA